MRKVSMLFFISSLGFIFLSCKCSKRIECPGFEGKVLVDWFPYSDTQRLTFKSPDGEVLDITLNKTNITAPHVEWGHYQYDPICVAEKTFASVETDTLNRPFFHLRLSEYKKTKNAQLSIEKNSVHLSNFTDSTIELMSKGFFQTGLDHFNSLDLRGKVFTNVVSMSRDTLTYKQAGIYKFYVAKGLGVIAFEQYPSLKLWVKQ